MLHRLTSKSLYKFGSNIPSPWYLEPDTWHLESRTWQLTPSTWSLAPGTWHLALDTWNLTPGTWHLAPETWNLCTWHLRFAPAALIANKSLFSSCPNMIFSTSSGCQITLQTWNPRTADWTVKMFSFNILTLSHTNRKRKKIRREIFFNHYTLSKGWG